jgi:hypothetical protein
MFIKPSGERVKLPPVDPAVLKTCYLYARSKDSVAISIGYDGERENPLDRNALSAVLIHPVLRDTQVGLDIINADRLPWSLRAEKLPNGLPNPVVNELRELVTKAGDPLPDLPINPLLDRLRKVADVAETGKAPDRIERLRKAALSLFDNSTRLDRIMLAVAEADETEEARYQTFVRLDNQAILKRDREQEKKAIEAAKDLTDERRTLLLKQIETMGLDEFYKPEELVKIRESQDKCRGLFKSMAKDRFEAIQSLLIWSIASNDREVPWRLVMAATLIPAASSQGSGLSLQELAPQVLLLMQHARLSLLTDESVQLKFKKSGDEMVFATRLKIRYIHGQVEAGENGLKRTDDVHESVLAGEKATGLIPQLETAFPPLKKTGEYASWIALMRWAIQKGNVGSLDLADLGSVAHTNQPTPDYLIQGSKSEVDKALGELGVIVKP